MERSLLSKTSAINLSPYFQSSKNTHLRGSNLVIQPRNGMVVFNFSQTTADEVSISFKRDSGNGLFVSYISGKGKEHVVTSKTGQRIFFPLDSTKKLQIYRTTRSRGDISLMDLELYEKKEVIDWNERLGKTDQYTCLSLDKNTLLASEGGIIKTTGKIIIKTDPDDAFVKTDDGLKFTSSCKVLEFDVVHQDGVKPKTKNVSELFDSSVSGFNQMYCEGANIKNNGVSIGHRGFYEMPINGIKSGKTYSVFISAQLLSGNGKMMFGFVPNNNNSKYNVVRNKAPTEFRATFTATSDNCSLRIWRHPSSKGDLLISRIRINVLGDNSQVLEKLPRHINIKPASPVTAKETEPEPIVISQPMQNHESARRVEMVSKHFAIFQEPVPIEGANHELVGSVMAHGYTARKWLNWLRVYYPKIVQNPKARTAICDVNNIVVTERVWLDAFVGDYKSRVAPLKGAKVIFTPSLPNKIMLKEWLGDAVNIQVAGLPLPKITNAKSPSGYFLYFENSRHYTKHLLSLWNSEYKLHVVGTKESIPVFSKYISEYEPFSSLSSQLSNATGLISLTENNHHVSGLIDLAFSMGVPVLTNNHQYLGKGNVVRHTTSAPISKKVLDTTLKSMKRAVPSNSNNIAAALKHLGVV